MWSDQNPNSEEQPSKSYSSQELCDLKDQNEKQLILIAQLKEMLRKEQSHVPQEKVEEYVNTLGRRSKKSRIKKEDSSSSATKTVSSSVNIDANKKERMNLLRQQLEENKAKLAERDKSQKGIEEMVTQLQAQIKDSQMSLTPLNVAEKNITYSKDTSQGELYNILVSKERKITELSNRVQKLEGNVLDLQENLKEKDSVIDARTKAITLMTDSLSKKGKSTLDALEETREQMRNMQENFIKIESEMKARQLALLNDLKMKNNTISDLEEEKSLLKKQLDERSTSFDDSRDGKLMDDNHSTATINELQKLLESTKCQLEQTRAENSQRISELEDTITNLKRLQSEDKPKSEDSEEIAKLKKQLEESNKSMIKVKAQHKSKIKELNKKIDQFKKASDANATIVSLQEENTRLNEKIAELEEEKGNLQLKMVESTSSSNGSTKLEDEIKDLEKKLAQKDEELSERDTVISLLESDILSMKNEMQEQNDKIKNLSNLEVTLSSEISSINYEEQLDRAENEIKRLLEENKQLMVDKEQLKEKIDVLEKEKQELGTKLESYIQENMELIDKLEKLSAEKVSSAESIEIVEGLTQQEKLELAAYQKNAIAEEENEKNIIEDESPQELNETVMQLTEDTSELLKKIDMFTQERKEVMAKLEALREENNSLTLKLKEIENNRDILAETYEQLQNEKEELLLNFQKHNSNETVLKQLENLQMQHKVLSEEHEKLKQTLKQSDAIIHEKHMLEAELADYKLRIEELESKLAADNELINNYKSVIDENKNELITSSTLINNLQEKLNQKEIDIQDMNVMIESLNRSVKNKEEDQAIDSMETQLSEIKSELNQSNEIITNLNSELVKMNKRINENESELALKIEELKHKDAIIEELQAMVEEKDKKFKAVNEEMREKYVGLQKQLDGNSSDLRNKIDELSTKNKEHLDKMKKIAANLKKKTQQYQDLEDRYKEEKEKWETESKEKDEVISKSEERLTSIIQQLKELEDEVTLKNSDLEASYNHIKELNKQVEVLERDNNKLETEIQELRKQNSKIHDTSLQQELSSSLCEEFDTHLFESQDKQPEKLKSLEMIIETNESDIASYKDKIDRLQAQANKLLDEKVNLERRCSELEEKLNLTSHSFKEKSLLEDQLELKLAEISATDDILNKKLQELSKENEILTKKNVDNEELIKKLKIKVKKTQDKINEMKNTQNDLKELESMNEQLRKQVNLLENNQRQIQNENESLQRKNMSDYEKIEADYQCQLQNLLAVKNEISVENEKLREAIVQLEGKERELQLEISEYQQQINNNEKEIVDFNEKVINLQNSLDECNAEIKNLKMQCTDLEKELLMKTAQAAVENIIEEAILQVCSVSCQTDELSEQSTFSKKVEHVSVPNIQWSTEDNTDWFKDASSVPPTANEPGNNQNWSHPLASSFEHKDDQKSTEPVVETNKEALLSKIRALEILLYNVDKEKEIALSECTDMINELTKLVYEKVNLDNSLKTDLESQIMSNQDIVDSSKKGALQKIEFESINPSFGQQSHPFIEETIKPKKAYLTYAEDKQQSLEAFGENDDGWGWGPEEAKLEEEYLQKAEESPSIEAMKRKIHELTEQVKVLQIERENHLEEIKQLQVKSGKLVKKCKELKSRNEQMSKKVDDGDFFNLDAAIQDELKLQNTQLEKKLKEISSELEREKAEKNSILKRVDVLTSANERMIELKEIQDAELLMLQRKNKEVVEKLQQYEWGNDGFSEGTKSTETSGNPQGAKRIQELEKNISDLTADNEELQALLDEQRKLRIEEEKSNKNICSNYEKELQGKLKEVEEKMQQLSECDEKLKSFDALVAAKEENISFLEGKILEFVNKGKSDTGVNGKILDLENELEQKEKELVQLQECLKQKEEAMERLQQDVNSKAQDELLCTNIISGLENTKLEQKENELVQIQELFKQKEEAMEILQQDVSSKAEVELLLTNKISELEKTLEEKEVIINDLQETFDHLNSKKIELQDQVSKLNFELDQERKRIEEFKRTSQEQQFENIGAFNEQTSALQHAIEERDNYTQQLIAQLDEANNSNILLKNEIATLKDSLEKQQSEVISLTTQNSEILNSLQNKEKEFEKQMSNALTELSQKWQVEVDQRGADVAESWKLHLESVETEFAAIQHKLKAEISELESKCNALVNENNELRKNVDADIRNEVEKISTLQQQITSSQQVIADVNSLLHEKQRELDSMTNLSNELEQLKQDLAERDQKISSLNIVIETTQKQFNEKREVVEEIVKILEKNTSWPVSFEKEDILSEFQRQLNEIGEKTSEIQRLSHTIDDFQVRLSTVTEKDQEIAGLYQMIEDFNQKLNQITEKDAEILRLNQVIHDLQLKTTALDEKPLEISQLKHLVDEYQHNQTVMHHELNKIKQEHFNYSLALEECNKKIQDLEEINATLKQCVEEKNQEVLNLNAQLQQTLNMKSDNNKEVEHLQAKLAQVKNDCTTLQQSLSEVQIQLFNTTQELTEKHNELETIKQQLSYSQQNYYIQQDEIEKLKQEVQQKEIEYKSSLEGLKQTQHKDLVTHYEELLAAKDLDIQNLNAELQLINNKYEDVTKKLMEEINLKVQLESEVKNLEEKLAEEAALVDDDSKQLVELKDIIEEQVVKIDQLKKELFEKSKQYDSLIAEMDIGRSVVTQQPATRTTSEKAKEPEEEDKAGTAFQAELDLVQYLLYQRDTRCEELTVELTQLLEERDTLQLRLSNAMRENQELHRQLGGGEATSSSTNVSGSSSGGKASAIFLAASGTELAREPLETEKLATKLSELKSIGYKKDKTLVDEQELRRQQQISIMEQHIKEASKLPPEAAAKLVDASYTLSRDVQSPSKVLLNWLWGKSTPKVNDT